MAITTRYGNEITILTSIRGSDGTITGCTARRNEDGAERSYLTSDLRAPAGAAEVYAAIEAIEEYEADYYCHACGKELTSEAAIWINGDPFCSEC